MESTTLAGGVTQRQINEWKAKYGENKVREIEIPIDDEGNTVIGYFRKPDLDVIAAAAQFAQSNPVKSGLILFDACWLGGDPIIKDDDECKMSAIEALNGQFIVRAAKVKNL